LREQLLQSFEKRNEPLGIFFGGDYGTKPPDLIVEIHGAKAAFGSLELSAAAKTPNAVQQPEARKSPVQYTSAKMCQNVLSRYRRWKSGV